MKISNYGTWIRDEVNQPCFRLFPGAGPDLNAPLTHLLSTGRIFGFVNRRGTLQLATSEGQEGFLRLMPNTYRCRSQFFGRLNIKGEILSLMPSAFSTGQSGRYGIGFAEFSGRIEASGSPLQVTQTFYAALNGDTGIYCEIALKNIGRNTVDGLLSLEGDCAPYDHLVEEDTVPVVLGDGFAHAPYPNPEISRIHLIGPAGWKSSREYHRLQLSHPINLKPGQSFSVRAWVGYGDKINIRSKRETLQTASLPKTQRHWKKYLAAQKLKISPQWMQDECVWATGQFLAFTGYDSSVKERYVSLGGYGFKGFCVRECGETALVLAQDFPDLAVDSLRWLAKLQYPTGDLPKAHHFKPPSKQIPNEPEDSDGEIWFILGGLQTILDAGIPDLLDERIPFCQGKPATFWEHFKRAFYWVRDGVGLGPHGLIKIRKGDWNDYLSCVGKEGRGESVMNSGMACRAFEMLAQFARKRGETGLAKEVESLIHELREAVSTAFDQTHFLYGYTDAGEPFGSHAENRIHLNAQTWAALGRCGTPEMRRKALTTAVQKCWTDVGLMLMSRPFSSPSPAHVSWCPIPEGEGENSGIWPQTVYWNIWALAEAGLTDAALRVWKAMSLRNHSRRFPQVPFGIFNAPDCYSSRFSGNREGWSQIELIDRGSYVPMNPMAAWPAFAMKKILASKRK